MWQVLFLKKMFLFCGGGSIYEKNLKKKKKNPDK